MQSEVAEAAPGGKGGNTSYEKPAQVEAEEDEADEEGVEKRQWLGGGFASCAGCWKPTHNKGCTACKKAFCKPCFATHFPVCPVRNGAETLVGELANKTTEGQALSPHLRLGVSRRQAYDFATFIKFPLGTMGRDFVDGFGYTNGIGSDTTYKRNEEKFHWITSAFGEFDPYKENTGYDLANHMRSWLKDSKNETKSVCEVLKEKGYCHKKQGFNGKDIGHDVGEANVFYSHVQSLDFSWSLGFLQTILDNDLGGKAGMGLEDCNFIPKCDKCKKDFWSAKFAEQMETNAFKLSEQACADWQEMKNDRPYLGTPATIFFHYPPYFKELQESTIFQEWEQQWECSHILFWMDFYALRQCKPDFNVQQVKILIGEIGWTLSELDREMSYLKRTFCVFELFATVLTKATYRAFSLNDIDLLDPVVPAKGMTCEGTGHKRGDHMYEYRREGAFSLGLRRSEMGEKFVKGQIRQALLEDPKYAVSVEVDSKTAQTRDPKDKALIDEFIQNELGNEEEDGFTQLNRTVKDAVDRDIRKVREQIVKAFENKESTGQATMLGQLMMSE